MNIMAKSVLSLLSATLVVVIAASCGLEAPKLEVPEVVVHKEIRVPAAAPPPAAKPNIPNTPEEKVDDIINQLRKAAIAYNVPTEVNIEDDFHIELLISLNDTVIELIEKIREKGGKVGDDISISRFVSVSLVAPDFDVKEISPEDQVLSTSEPTKWKWRLTPKKEGEYSIDLAVKSKIQYGDKLTERHINSYDRTITVKVTPAQKAKRMFDEHGKWLLSTILAPIFLWWLKKGKDD